MANAYHGQPAASNREPPPRAKPPSRLNYLRDCRTVSNMNK